MNDVYEALACYLRIPIEVIRDDQRLHHDLGLDAIDLVTIVLRLEDLEPWHGEFPVLLLEHTSTVGDLVALHRDWSDRDTIEVIERVSPSDPIVGERPSVV